MPFPSVWTDVLTRLRDAGGHDAVIAGGAVRDFLLGRDIKDIDVFLRSRGKEEDRRIVQAAFPGATGLEHLSDYHPQYEELSSIWDATLGGEHLIGMFPPDGWPVVGVDEVQVMFLNMDEDMTPGRAIVRIDLGICRVAFDGQAIHPSLDFMGDLRRQRMTVCRDLSPANLERTKRRFTRLSAKYPTYTFNNPYEANAHR